MTEKEEVFKRILEDEKTLKNKIKVFDEINEILASIKKEYSLHFDIFLGGSMAKGTDIRGSDLDIFLLFSEIFDPIAVLRILKKKFREAREEYSEHPYIILDYPDFSVDIVPAYRIDSGNPLVTSVDRTPLHVEFVKNNFTSNMKNEARIMKQFLKGIGVYGAESSVQGFSGYVSELLIYYFKTFEGVVENASHWRIPHVVNCETSNFPDANLVILDPVDINRNAAANVSKENLATFILACKLFRWERYEKFFFPSEESFETPKFGYVVSIPCKKCNGEILIPNMRRVVSILRAELESKGFPIIYASVHLLDKGYIVLIPVNIEVNDASMHTGPPVTNGNVLDFIRKWGNGTRFGPPFMVGDKICVLREREHLNFLDSLTMILGKIKFANDFSLEFVDIMELNDSRVPDKVKRNFVRPSIGMWISGDI